MDPSANNFAGLLHKLCVGISSDPDGAYELAVSYLSSTTEKSRSVHDEKLLCQKIQARISSMSTRDANKFNECYARLKNSFVLKQRVSVLALLLALSEAPQHAESTQQLFPIPFFSTSKSTNGSLGTTGSSGTTSTSSKQTFGTVSWGGSTPKQKGSDQSLPSDNSNVAIALLSTDRSNESACVRDAVLAATGVKARRAGSGPRPMQALYARIAHLGVLHDRLKEFIDPSSGLLPQGLMGEGLVASVRDELTEYYRSVALLQSMACDGDGGAGTLRRVCVWALEPLHRLTWLANIAHAAHHKKGGELASCVHHFVRHGDERVSTLARRLLTAMTYPLLLMLTRWLLHGEIDDPFNEFFIESRSGVPIDRMWHDKYRVREWMVPSFMSRELAAQILATGKSVVFMREACADEPGPSDHAQHLQDLLNVPKTDSENGCGASVRAEGAVAAWWEAGALAAGVAGAHGVAAARLLAALTSHHHLLDHLAAHRRYLLLAQGDFVHHLMTLLQEELNKPASQLYVHNLTCTLEAAVRATNAQFEPPHVLARLHVNLYPNCDGRDDCGWDVFALQYRVDGPLGTLFPATCAARYRALFTQLWRVKRIEYSLHDAWREHAILNKRLKAMPEVWHLMRRVSCLRAEALRLCGALQEASSVGAEPAWAELLAAAAAHRDLDTLLRLHHAALDRHSIHAMIHHTTQVCYQPVLLQEASSVGAEPAWAELLAAAAAHRDLDTLLRLHHAALDRHSIHAMIHHTTQVCYQPVLLQEASSVGAEPAWAELLAAAAAHRNLDTLLRLHHAALDRHSIHAMIHHTTQVCYQPVLLQEASSVGAEPAWAELLAAAAAHRDLDTLLRLHHAALDRHSIHAMIHHTTQVCFQPVLLQEASSVGAEPAWAELLAAAAAHRDLDTLLRLHHAALDRHSIHAMIHHTTQVCYQPVLLQEASSVGAEPAWAELLAAAAAHRDLDTLLRLHHAALDRHSIHAMIHHTTQVCYQPVLLQEASSVGAEPAWAELLAAAAAHRDLDTLLRLHHAALDRHSIHAMIHHTTQVCYQPVLLQEASSVGAEPAWAELLAAAAAHRDLDTLLRLHHAALDRHSIHAMIHHTTQVCYQPVLLQEASSVGAEPAWAELLAAAAAHRDLDTLLRLHHAALDRHSIHAMIHHTTQVCYQPVLLQEASSVGAEPAWAELLAAAAAHRDLDTLLRLHHAALDRHSKHAMIHHTTQVCYQPVLLQEASSVGAEPAWAELLAAAAAHRDLDTLLRLHHAALDRHSIHAMIHHTTQVCYQPVLLQEASSVGAEPAWAELLAAAAAHRDLDTLLRLHHAALDRHSIHAMIHHTTQELQSYLGNVLNEILALRQFETTLHAGIDAELERREDMEQLRAERLAKGEYAFTAAEEARDKEKRKIFLQFLASRKADLNVWSRTYRGHVSTLILKLALHAEVSLQMLAFRLDYSDFYKRGDAKLHQPLTYQHKRLSEIGLLSSERRKLMDKTRKK